MQRELICKLFQKYSSVVVVPRFLLSECKGKGPWKVKCNERSVESIK